jgi:hypothetical protein
MLATGAFTVDPVADGARMQVRTASGATALDVTLPAGNYAAPGPGWLHSGAFSKYTFLDRRPGGTNGIGKMIVRDRGAGAVQITIIGRTRAAAGAGRTPLG